MKKRVFAAFMATLMVAGSLAGCGSKASSGDNSDAANVEEGKVINIYSWNDEFRQRLESVYPEVESTSKDGSVTKLKMEQRFTGLLIQIRMVYISRNWMKHF